MTTSRRPYSSDDDAFIRARWGKIPSSVIADMLDRNHGSLRGRAQKLRLTPVSNRVFKARPHNQSAAKPHRSTPSLPKLKCAAEPQQIVRRPTATARAPQPSTPRPVVSADDLHIRAQHFCQWRREVHGL